MIRSKLQDRKLLQLIQKEVDIKINSFGLKIRKLEKISEGVSKPVVIGEVQKNVKMN